MMLDSSILLYIIFFFFKQKTAYEMRISDWSSDVCSSDLGARGLSAPLKVGLSWGAQPAGHADAIDASRHLARTGRWLCTKRTQIGRASCRERVCQYV